MIEAGLDHLQIDDYLGERYFGKIEKEILPFLNDPGKEGIYRYEKDCTIVISSNYNVKQIKSPVKDKEDNIVRNERGNPVNDPNPSFFPYTYWNRAGLVNLNPDIPVPNKDCNYPSTQMYVNWKGDLLLCCCDWEEEVLFGNLSKERIEDVWTNKKYNHYRETLKKGKRKELEMCRKCNKGGAKSEEDRQLYKNKLGSVKTTGLFKG